jgi:hypothetical protein
VFGEPLAEVLVVEGRIVEIERFERQCGTS